jgi:hypothetical protein
MSSEDKENKKSLGSSVASEIRDNENTEPASTSNPKKDRQ